MVEHTLILLCLKVNWDLANIAYADKMGWLLHPELGTLFIPMEVKGVNLWEQ